MSHHNITDVFTYLRAHAGELGERILSTYPALHRVEDQPSPLLSGLLRRPFPAQALAIMGLVKRWELARSAKVIAECGTGKTLISLGAMHVHSDGRPFTALAMVPPHIVEKWAREAFQTIPGIRVFLVDSLRNGATENSPHRVNEVRLKRGAIVREGLRTSLTDLRLRRDYGSARKRWQAICSRPGLFVVGRDRAKLGYFWRHAYQIQRSGRYRGCLVNPESGAPIITDEERLTVRDFEKVRIAEVLTELSEKSCRQRFAPVWEADNRKIPRVAPIDFISRYMAHFFDYAVCDELHQLSGDTAQGNALGALASCADRVAGLTGTLLGGYADDLYNILFRLQPQRMVGKGYEWGTTGRSAFAQDYGVLETITKIEPAENACSDGKATVTVRRKPGASPLLFGEFLMDTCAFVFLEDISDALPAYEESVVQVEMDAPMAAAYEQLEADMREALKAHRGNRSVLSIMLNALLLYPDHPYGLGRLWGSETDEDGRRQRFLIAETQDLPEQFAYAKERRLTGEIKQELAEGRRCQVFAVYTQKRDVTSRLERILREEGISCAVMRSNIDTSKREAWYQRRLKEGVQVFIAHPKLVETGLDLLFAPTILFYESGYSLHTLRQASRRSWRIGQNQPVRVKFLCYEGTMQVKCLRLMGKKLLVALAMEGKFAGEGLQSLEEDDDMLTSMAKELVEKNGIGDSADSVWRQLNAEHQRLFPTRTEAYCGDAELQIPSTIETETSAISREPINAALNSSSVEVFGEKYQASRNVRRKPRSPTPEQGSLFNWN
ncbi:MAG TPA: helicase-related protein [Terriglobales bacterium]|nr:helicase-related protein [Terriglobales bacterium]